MKNIAKRSHKVETIDLREALTDLRVTAEIAASEDGGPVRTIINGRHRKPVGRYASRKARRSLPWESCDERAYFWLCEADTNVDAYLCQPHRLTIFLEEGRPLVFYPDVRRDLVGGGVEIVEIKKTYDEDDRLTNPAYALKLELARQVYAGLGWSFRVITAPEMQKGFRLRNAKAVQRNRFAKFDARDSMPLLAAIRDAGGQVTMDHATELLGCGPRAAAKLRAIIVRRVIHIDLDRRLNGQTAVSAVLNPSDANAWRER